jgi:hypothetical protein
MTFQEIFNESGLYTSDSFAEGVCYQVENGNLYFVQYRDKNDLFPLKENALVYKQVFDKRYRHVFTIQSLFKKK